MKMTAREVIMKGNEGYKFRDVIDNLYEDVIIDCMQEYAINFYEWMDDNYKRVNDGYVVRMSLDKNNPIIIVKKALEEYENRNKI